MTKALDKWAYENGVGIDFSRPGKPTDNAKNDSFNGRFREKCLNAHGFLSLEDARRKIEVRHEYYNGACLHRIAVDDTVGIGPPVYRSDRFGSPRRAGIFQPRPERKSGLPHDIKKLSAKK